MVHPDEKTRIHRDAADAGASKSAMEHSIRRFPSEIVEKFDREN
jgi:hypothetical protein